MTSEEFLYLQTEEAQRLIEENIDADPFAVALRLNNPTVAMQLKNLQKCRQKLPSYYAARCIIPTISYQQSSSELAAFIKLDSGDIALDLTCGLGVDSYALSRSFSRVTAVEIDPLRAEIARYNFAKLGVTNIQVISSFAEDYIAKCSTVDLIYVDPSRRSVTGSSIYAVEQCQPNVVQLLPLLRNKSNRISVKLSPLFDVDECFRLFGEDSHCTVISINNECKEVVVQLLPGKLSSLSVVTVRHGHTECYDFTRAQIGCVSSENVQPRYLCVPDIGFYKSRTVSAMMDGHKHYYSGGYIITEDLPERFCGSVYLIDEMMPYQPKVFRKRFKRATVHLRNFPYTVEQIAIKAGGDLDLFFSRYCGEPTIFLVTLMQK